MITLTLEQAKARLDCGANLAVILHNNNRGNHSGLSRREPGDVKTIEEKTLIASLAVEHKITGGKVKDVAAEFGLAPTTVSGYIHGRFNSNKGNDNSVSKPYSKDMLIAEKSLERLVDALDRLDEYKLDRSDANELASVAVKMATVNEKIKGGTQQGNQVHVHIFAPQLVNETHFDTIEVSQ